MTLHAETQTEPFLFRSHGGGSLPYCQGVFNAGEPGPYRLLILFHGAGERGTDNEMQLVHGARPIVSYALRNKIKLVFLAPQCPENAQWVDTPWSDLRHTMNPEPSRSMALALELLDSKTFEFDIDPAQIYVTGLSMGGYGTWDAVCRRPDFFAGALAVCGGADTEQAVKLKNFPIRFFHGDADDAVPVSRSRDMARALRDAGNMVFSYTEYPGCGHNAWDSAYTDDSNLDWLFSRRKG